MVSLIIDMSSTLPILTKVKASLPLHTEPLARKDCTPEYLISNQELLKGVQQIFVITPEQEHCKEIFAHWENVLFQAQSPKNILSYCIKKSCIEAIPVYSIDKGSAILLALAEDGYYQKISMRMGITCIYAGEYRTVALLMYKGLCYGTFGFCSALVEREELIHALEQFKNLWLTDEEVQEMGGCGSIFTPNIPQEAIFSATICVGLKTKKYEGVATILPKENCTQYIHSLPLMLDRCHT